MVRFVDVCDAWAMFMAGVMLEVKSAILLFNKKCVWLDGMKIYKYVKSLFNMCHRQNSGQDLRPVSGASSSIHVDSDFCYTGWSHCGMYPINMIPVMYPYGDGSKPYPPGEHQNSWQMDVHPPKNGMYRYWSIATWSMLIWEIAQSASPFLGFGEGHIPLSVPRLAPGLQISRMTSTQMYLLGCCGCTFTT